LPYQACFSGGSKTLVLKVPRRELTARVGNTRDILARTVKPLSRENGLASSTAAMLPSLAGNIGVATAEMVGRHALDLLAVSFAETLQGARPRVSSVRALLISNIRSVVESRLTEADLDAQKVADPVGISVRYANEVLGDHLTSLSRLIQARRLARCRQALEDPNQAHRTVSEIAYGWGFSDMTHFGRRFKKAYGIRPSEYQADAKALRTTSAG
jgi:AraC family transcriptional activator of tynA and feaB